MSEITPEKTANQLPADYYCTPVPEGRRLLPRWLTLGCGTASLVVLILMFAAGAMVNSGRAAGLVRWFFDRLQRDVIEMCDANVKPQQRTTFAAEMSTLQERTLAGKVKSDDLLSFFQLLRDDTLDGHVTPAEIEALTAKIHTINSGP